MTVSQDNILQHETCTCRMGIMTAVTEILVATFPSCNMEGSYHHGLIARNSEVIFLLYQELKL